MYGMPASQQSQWESQLLVVLKHLWLMTHLPLVAQKKKQIELDIEKDFEAGLEGIKKLPYGARFGVYVAYVYYYALFAKIKSLSASNILTERIRIPDLRKYLLIVRCYFKHALNLI